METRPDLVTHLDARGEARMVDVSDRSVTVRTATASARVVTTPGVLAAIGDGTVPKGDVAAVARVAGIMGAKQTPRLIPLCHPIDLDGVEVTVELRTDAIEIDATARTLSRTGVEMEALTAATVAGLAVIDMVKSMDPAATLTGVGVVAKDGGRSGPWRRVRAVALAEERAEPEAEESQVPPLAGLVITVSDRCSAGIAVDRSGPLAGELLAAHGVLSGAPMIIPDDPDPIAAAVRGAARDGVDVVILTGGTGIGPRDRTPEALRQVLDREIPGIAEAIRAASRSTVATADLSRSVAGVLGRTFVLALPGSVGGVRDGIAVAGPLIRHAVEVLGGAAHPAGPVAPAAPSSAPSVRIERCEVTAEPLDVAEYQRLVRGPESGAVVSFTGVVRGHDANRPVSRLDFEAHPSATRVLTKVVAEVVSAIGPGSVSAVAVGHRTGALEVGETAFVVVVAAAHRGPAFDACSRLVDEVKRLLPVWKHQVFVDGSSEWVNCG